MTALSGVALVTGGSSGIGRAVAASLSSLGLTVHIAGRNAERLSAAAREMKGSVITHTCDLATDDGIRTLANRVTEAGALNILVHSAGSIILGDVDAAAWDDLDQQYRINLRAPFLLTKALLAPLKASRGQIVFVNSTAGLVASDVNPLYSATKRALHSLADSVRGNLNVHGIRVLSVFPGRTATPMQESVHKFEGRPYDPSGLIRAADVADLIVNALASPRNVEVTDIMVRPSRNPAQSENRT